MTRAEKRARFGPVITARVPMRLVVELDLIAGAGGQSRAALIRECIEEGIRRRVRVEGVKGTEGAR